MESRAAIGGSVRGGRGSLLLGAPEPRRDGAERQRLLLLLGELGEALLLLLTDGQTDQSEQSNKTHTHTQNHRVRLISVPTCAS